MYYCVIMQVKIDVVDIVHHCIIMQVQINIARHSTLLYSYASQD